MNIIAAADLDMGIGCNGNLLYDIPEDKAFFKAMTLGNTIIMGRKTFESLPFKPLPDRRSIILTKNKSYYHKDIELCHDMDSLFNLISDIPTEKIFVIGGEQIYRSLLGYCDTAFITKVYARKEADSFIPDFDSMDEWHISEKSELKNHNGIFYRFITYKRTQSIV
ncbi:MAG: dihydrofolate reductase [Ruminococcus sp.]|nr:dihydrofolate reductase [Ruminococcus sp.]